MGKESKYKLPIYHGNETEFEDIIYSFFRKVGEDLNFIFKVKKTNTKIDEILYSQEGTIGGGKCDGYILANIEDKKDNFIGFLELESNGNLEKGIKQINQYSRSIKENWDTFFEFKEYFLSIVFDGKKILLSKEFRDRQERVLDLDIKKDQSTATSKLLEEINQLIPSGNNIDYEENEKKIIKKFKELIRNRGSSIKKNRAELMTVMSSIYNITHKDKLIDGIEYLEKSIDEIDLKILKSWKNISGKIEYTKKKNLIGELYSEIAIPMSIIANTKDIDLYGYFYEELSEKESKQEGGEFYTPRHIIKPIIKFVYNNLLKWDRDELENKKVLDNFVGSGSFLYEYLKYLHKKYDLDQKEIDGIAKKSCFGADNSDIEASQLNMYLVGDGNVNLKLVKTSINWRKAYVISKDKLQNSFESYRETLNFFIKVYLNSRECDKLRGFNFLDENNNLTNEGVKEILSKENEVYRYEDFDEFLKENLSLGSDGKINKLFGDVDLLFTNVPYGSIKNKEGKDNWCYKDYPKRLETNSLRDCIDILKPKTENNAGGIGIIIIPSGILETNENLNIRQYLFKNCNLLADISLPKYTFAPYTTQKTHMIIIQKKSQEEIKYYNPEQYKQNTKTFMYISDVDGKAQSDKRYEVNLITKNKFGLEWLHNDFKENFGNFDGEYLSKIERCWELSIVNQHLDYNQNRIIPEWNGKEWIKLDGKKWGSFEMKSLLKTMIKEKGVNKSLGEKIRYFLDLKNISLGEFIKNKTEFLIEAKEQKIKKNNREKALFAQSEIDFLYSNVSKIYEDSEGKMKYFEKIKYYDFSFIPENYLKKGIDERLTLEDIKKQLKSLM